MRNGIIRVLYHDILNDVYNLSVIGAFKRRTTRHNVKYNVDSFLSEPRIFLSPRRYADRLVESLKSQVGRLVCLNPKAAHTQLKLACTVSADMF
jgi:hypothetical protein